MHAHFEKLSDRQIKKARAHAKTIGAGLVLEKAPFHRTRIDLMRLNHFLSFADQPYFCQDVSHGTRTLTLDSGEHLIMPNVVRTVARSTVIAQYFRHCHQEKIRTTWTIDVVSDFESKGSISTEIVARAGQHRSKRARRLRCFDQNC